MTKEDSGGRPVFGVDERTERLSHDVIGAAIEVHRALGPGFLESQYENALCIELAHRQIAFERQKPLPMTYRGKPIGDYRVDLTVDDTIIMELKAVEKLADMHRAQVISYLNATGLRLGLLINFNVPLLKEGIHRIIH